MLNKKDAKQSVQLKTYRWRGRDRNGQFCKNEITAANEQLVHAYLQRQGIIPTSVIEKPRAILGLQGQIKTKDIISFSRKMATMLKAGLSVVQSLDLIAEGIRQSQRLHTMVTRTQQDVESGRSFSDALSQYPPHFHELYIALVSAGEEAGVLDEAMDKIANNLEKSARIKRKIKKAMIYPSIVICSAIIVTAILLIKVIPAFESFFADFNAELPTLTIWVLNLSKQLRDWGWIVILATMIALLLFIWMKKHHHALRQWSNRIAFHLPVTGHILRLGAISRFSRTLAILFEAGIPLIKSLRTTAPATGNVIYEKATNRIAQDIENGSQLNFAMQNTGQFDSFAVQMVSIGEESGNLGEMLNNVAEFYEEELDYRVENLTTLLEPFIILLLALIVGVLIIAMYLPIFMLGDIVG